MCQTVEKFTIERVNKSGAVFDNTKLRLVTVAFCLLYMDKSCVLFLMVILCLEMKLVKFLIITYYLLQTIFCSECEILVSVFSIIGYMLHFVFT